MSARARARTSLYKRIEQHAAKATPEGVVHLAEAWKHLNPERETPPIHATSGEFLTFGRGYEYEDRARPIGFTAAATSGT